LKDLRRCELHLRLFLRQTTVVVDADERGGGDGEGKSDRVSHGLPPGIEHCNSMTHKPEKFHMGGGSMSVWSFEKYHGC
jgi:hypothetical protein